MSSFANKGHSATQSKHHAHQIVREVQIDSSLVGLLIGKQGLHIKKISDSFSVGITVGRATVGDNKRVITVTGNNEKDVEEAIEEIMIERIAIPIENQIIEYVCGQNDKNLSFFHDRSGVLQLNVESQANGNFSLVAAGTKRALDDLTTIVQTHIGLYEPY